MPDGIRLSMYQAAAMLGNFWVESKVNPYNYHWNQGTYGASECGQIHRIHITRRYGSVKK